MRVDVQNAGVIGVGNLPALLSIANEKNATALSNGADICSADYSLLQPEPSKPRIHRPLLFIWNQIQRTLFNYPSLDGAERTGLFPSNSLDWVGWITHPTEWANSAKVAIVFQKALMMRQVKPPHTEMKRYQAIDPCIRQLGGATIDGTLTEIYIDSQRSGGVVAYKLVDQVIYRPFSRLVLSLGSRPLVDAAGHPLFGVIAARITVALAFVDLPIDHSLATTTSFGETGYMTKLSETPVQIQNKEGQPLARYLVRVTGGACITPNLSERESVNYDATVATGLFSAIRNRLHGHVEPIFVRGFNQQVSQHEANWFSPHPGIQVQYEADGGAISEAPRDLAPHSF